MNTPAIQVRELLHCLECAIHGIHQVDDSVATLASLRSQHNGRLATRTLNHEGDKHVPPKSFVVEGTRVKVPGARHEIKTIRVKF